MKNEFVIDQSLDCSKTDDIQKIVILAATLAKVEYTTNLVEQLNDSNDMFVSKYCQWFFCRMNTECGQTSSSESNYLYMKDKINCPATTMDSLSCDECNLL